MFGRKVVLGMDLIGLGHDITYVGKVNAPKV